MQRAVIYARFSSDMQREESIDAQVRACKAYAKNKATSLSIPMLMKQRVDAMLPSVTLTIRCWPMPWKMCIRDRCIGSAGLHSFISFTCQLCPAFTHQALVFHAGFMIKSFQAFYSTEGASRTYETAQRALRVASVHSTGFPITF